jgi:NodT family efflux transporter outer membrane factor (OMF) lipoprotein
MKADAMDSPSRRLPALAAVLACALALGGCAAIAPRDSELPAVPVPASWSEPAAPSVQATAGIAPSAAGSRAADARPADSLATWWLVFDDPQLAGLIDRALRVNASLRATQAALQQARALRDVQSAGLLPLVDGAASAQRAKPSGGNAANSFRAGLDASWELDVFGGQRSGVEAAEADVRAARMRLAEAQVSLAAEVALAYVDLRRVQALAAIARNNLAAQTETLQITRWRAQAGLTTSVEVEQARAAAEQTAAQIPLLESGAAQARNALAVLTGRAPGALLADLDETGPLPRAPGSLLLAIPAETLRQRPDVRESEQRIAAALARASQADAARYPSFRLGGVFELRASTLGDLASGAAIANALLGGVSVPLFDGGAARARVRVEEAALEQARANYEVVVLAALKEVEDALVELRNDGLRLERLQQAAEAAGNAALLANHRYSSGLIDFQVVLDTQRSLLVTQETVANASAGLVADHVRLYKALGGGWLPDDVADADGVGGARGGLDRDTDETPIREPR